MSFCIVSSKQYSYLFENQQRYYKVILLNSESILILFKDLSYHIFNIIQNSIAHKGHFKQSYNRYQFISSQQILLISDQIITLFNFHHNTIQNYKIEINNLFSKLYCFKKSKYIIEINQNAQRQSTQIRLISLEDLQISEILHFGFVFLDPHLVKLNEENEFLLIQKSNNQFICRRYIIENGGITLIQQKFLKIENKILLVKIYYLQELLIIFGTCQKKTIFIKYNLNLDLITENKSMSLGYSLATQFFNIVHNNFALIIRKNQSEYIQIITIDGKIMFEEELDQKNYNLVSAGDGKSLIKLQNSNEKYFYKIKPNIPTLLKFKIYKFIEKKSIYVKFAKELMPNINEELLHNFLDLL